MIRVTNIRTKRVQELTLLDFIEEFKSFSELDKRVFFNRIKQTPKTEMNGITYEFDEIEYLEFKNIYNLPKVNIDLKYW